MRVQIPPYTDRWMMGDRYGLVVKITKSRKRKLPTGYVEREVAHVLLDISNKVVRVLLDDCTVV